MIGLAEMVDEDVRVDERHTFRPWSISSISGIT
jgi:hypothetical protein